LNIYQKLLNIQAELKAPKNQYSEFGKYNYRSCEDILEALKPLMIETKTILTITDEMVQVGDRYYVKSIATLIDTEELGEIKATAYAREDENKAKMDLSQMTGSASSYARKYALNGLFAIDETKDADANPNTENNQDGKEEIITKNTGNKKTDNKKTKPLSDAQIKRLYTLGKIAGYDENTVKGHVKVRFNKNVEDMTRAEYDAVCKGYEGRKW